MAGARPDTRARGLLAMPLLAGFLFAAGCTTHRATLDAAALKVLMDHPDTSAAGAAAAPGQTQANRFQDLRREQPAAPAKAPAPLAGFVDPLTKSGERAAVDLESCLRRALANNLGVQIAQYGPPIARTAVREAEAMFDPAWFLNNALGRIKQQSGSFITGATVLIANQWEFATGIESLLPTGGTVGLSQDWTRLRSNSAFISPNPQYDSNLVLSLSQPLLRGGGVEVTRSPIVLARLDQEVSVADFKARLMAALLEVESTYWDLVVAETQVQAVAEALDAAKESLRIARRRFEAGADRRVVVSLAESAVTLRQADLVAARLRLAQTSDRLKRFINDPELPLTQPTVLAATEAPMTEPMPVGVPMLQASLAAAFVRRPEMQQAEARLEQAALRERIARNDLLPQLDLSGSFGLNGLSGDVERSLDRQFETQYRDWSAALDFRVPIGNRARTAAHTRSQLEAERTLKTREDVRQQVTLDVTDAVRNLAAAEEAILARRAARLAAEQTLKDEEAYVSAGAALLKDLLDAQRDLADAKVAERRALADYMIGLAALERAKGTLLDYNNIRVVDDGQAAPVAPAKPDTK